MATAKAIKAQPVEPPVTGVALELSVEEAKIVLAIVGYVTGAGPTRQATDRIYHAVKDALSLERGPDWGTYFDYPHYALVAKPGR
jgi:hypothetical protein